MTEEAFIETVGKLNNSQILTNNNKVVQNKTFIQEFSSWFQKGLRSNSLDFPIRENEFDKVNEFASSIDLSPSIFGVDWAIVNEAIESLLKTDQKKLFIQLKPLFHHLNTWAIHLIKLKDSYESQKGQNSNQFHLQPSNAFTSFDESTVETVTTSSNSASKKPIGLLYSYFKLLLKYFSKNILL